MKATYIALVALAAAAAVPAQAQQQINEAFASSGSGELEVYNLSGSVRVTAWDRNEISVTGRLGAGTERLEVDRNRERPTIRVVIPRNARNVRGSDLEIRVPVGKAVRVTTVSADIEVGGVSGDLSLQSTSGDVAVSANSRQIRATSTSGDVEVQSSNGQRVVASTTSGDVRVSGTVRENVSAESVSGDVMVTASTPEVRAKVVSGDLLLRGVSGRVSAASVSGDVEIRDSRIQYGSFESVSGNLLYAGELASGGALNLKSHSGDVEMMLPSGVAAEFEVQTFSGDIRSDFGGDVQRTSRHAPGRQLRVTTGRGGGLVSINTFSGTVKLGRR